MERVVLKISWQVRRIKGNKMELNGTGSALLSKGIESSPEQNQLMNYAEQRETKAKVTSITVHHDGDDNLQVSVYRTKSTAALHRTGSVLGRLAEEG